MHGVCQVASPSQRQVNYYTTITYGRLQFVVIALDDAKGTRGHRNFIRWDLSTRTFIDAVAFGLCYLGPAPDDLKTQRETNRTHHEVCGRGDRCSCAFDLASVSISPTRWLTGGCFYAKLLTVSRGAIVGQANCDSCAHINLATRFSERDPDVLI